MTDELKCSEIQAKSLNEYVKAFAHYLLAIEGEPKEGHFRKHMYIVAPKWQKFHDNFGNWAYPDNDLYKFLVPPKLQENIKLIFATVPYNLKKDLAFYREEFGS